ncbi:hypothetical protein E4U17_000578 [Claviceps sp. LM77 group G4]|nr:hypothetical protein E4U17_000578 [Claviceps sp. LM77 group G4]KAG6074034.1 hypothetical protein E4U33_002664 [Claviceps sp. LM78 group G4]
MSRFFPHTPYAEDQPLPYTILTTHVLTRGLTTGSLLGITLTSIRQLIPPLRRPGPNLSRVLLASSTGSILGVGLMALALGGRMYGRDGIEWHDRSWRLLENKGQMEMDDWTYIGMGLGGLGGVVGSGAAVRNLGRSRAVLGGIGAGGALGMLGEVAWRVGLKGGKFPEGVRGRERNL